MKMRGKVVTERRVSVIILSCLLFVVTSVAFSHQENESKLKIATAKVYAAAAPTTTVIDLKSIRDSIGELQEAYSKKDLEKFLSFFSEQEYSDYGAIKSNLESGFQIHNQITLEISISSIAISGDVATIIADWSKSWDGFFTDQGLGHRINVKKIEGAWKIVNLDRSIFNLP
jgi:hypothetical protein